MGAKDTMVQIVEFRVIMPLLLEEYRVAQMYMVNKIQEQQTGGGEGVEVLINKPFENEEFGRGQYTSKIYHLQSKIPSWLSAFVSTKFMYIEEEAWNAFPKCKTVLKCPYLNRFKLTIETIHVADNGNTVNAHNLDKDALALRKVEYLDIASNVKDYWNYVIGGPEIDLTKFKSEITGRGPLAPGWQAACDPVMTAYKLVTVDVPYWGFGYRLEQALLGAERALFLESHKQCFHWIDEWFGLTYEDVRRMEMENDLALNQKLGKLTIVSNACENGSSAGIAESASEPVKKDASLPSSVSVRS